MEHKYQESELLKKLEKVNANRDAPLSAIYCIKTKSEAKQFYHDYCEYLRETKRFDSIKEHHLREHPEWAENYYECFTKDIISNALNNYVIFSTYINDCNALEREDSKRREEKKERAERAKTYREKKKDETEDEIDIEASEPNHINLIELHNTIERWIPYSFFKSGKDLAEKQARRYGYLYGNKGNTPKEKYFMTLAELL